MDPVLQRLHDENEVRKLVVRFSIGMDTRDVEMFRSAWADEIDLDLPALAGDAVVFAGRRRSDDYARDVVALLSEFEVTQHVSTNHLIAVDGDTAHCTCYTVAQHRLTVQRGDSHLTAGARYDLVAVRSDDLGWRFRSFTLSPLWTSGNTSLWREATRRMQARSSRTVGS